MSQFASKLLYNLPRMEMTMTTITIKNSKILGISLCALLIASVTFLPAFAIDSETIQSEKVIRVNESFAPTPVLTENGTMALAATTQPYVAAYHDIAPHFGIKKAKTTCNFSGTDRTKIQTDNYLTCVESLQNPTGTDHEDWGYQAYVTLQRTGNLIVGADVWIGCENLFPFQSCNGTPAGTIVHKYSNAQFITANPTLDDVTVFMEWNSAGTIVSWYYQVGTGTKTLFGSFTKTTTQNPYLNTGTNNLGLITAKYFQAGVGSAYNIGQSGWFVNVKNPAYSTSVSGSYISFYTPAKSVEGDQAHWDASFKWGGSVYSGVNADYNCKPTPVTPSGQVKFKYTGITLGNDVKLWGVC